MQLKLTADNVLAFLLILVGAIWIALARPLTIDLLVYAEWLTDLDAYQFDAGFVAFGRMVRLITDNVRVLVFLVSVALQVAVLRCCLIFFPGVLRFAFVLAGITAYWHVSLSSNVIRNGLAIALAALILSGTWSNYRVRLVISFIVSILVHWASFIYFFVLSVARSQAGLRFRSIVLLLCLGGGIAYVGFNFFDFGGKLAVYGSTELYASDRSSQVPRFAAQVCFGLAALFFGIAPASLRRPLWAAMVVLVVLLPFPEAFSRLSVLTGILLHVVYFGWLLSCPYFSSPLKLSVTLMAMMVQVFHPSTLTLLGWSGGN